VHPQKRKVKKPWKAANLMNRRGEISNPQLKFFIHMRKEKKTKEFVAKNNVQLQKSCDDLKLFFL
jgi:hypothetical protein